MYLLYKYFDTVHQEPNKDRCRRSKKSTEKKGENCFGQELLDKFYIQE
jgi:hypothetical protein